MGQRFVGELGLAVLFGLLRRSPPRFGHFEQDSPVLLISRFLGKL
jgi:hypothetical protein